MAIKTTPPPTNGAKNCLEDWEQDLKKASNRLKTALEEKAGTGAKFSNASLWEDKLRAYWICLQQTEEVIENIAGHLELFLEQSQLVCNNVTCSREAITHLVCGVKDIFQCTDNLKEKITEFFMKVECLNDDSINTKTSFIVECITNIQNKLNEAIAKQQELIKKVIDIFKCVYEIEEAICSEQCGVIGNVNGLIKLFPKSGEDPEHCGIDKSCQPKPDNCPSIPLNCDKLYIYTRDEQDLAESEKEAIRVELEKVCKEFEKIASCKRGLEDAIACSKEVKECK